MKHIYYVFGLLIFTAVSLFAGTGPVAQTMNISQDKQHFIENKGQWPEHVLFLAKLPGMNAWITKTGVIYDYYKIDKSEMPNATEQFPMDPLAIDTASRKRGHVIKMELEQDNSNELMVVPAKVQGRGQKRDKTEYNYFIGNDSTKWASHVPLYEEAVIEGYYPGIDMRFYFEDNSLRYDFIAAPGADISQIKMKYRGQDKLKITENNSLALETSLGAVVHGRLMAYQMQDGVKQEVTCKFKKAEEGSISFDTGEYDPEKELIIDPLIYSTYMAGGDEQCVMMIKGFENGDCVFSGWTYSSQIPVTEGAYSETIKGHIDHFLGLLSSKNYEIPYCTFLGGENDEYGCNLSVSEEGLIYICGYTRSDNYPVTNGCFQDEHHGQNQNKEGTISVLNSDLSELVYSTYLGGSSDDMIIISMFDDEGNIIIAGSTESTDIVTTEGVIDRTANGGWDCIIACLNPELSQLIFASYFGGIGNDNACGLALDDDCNIYISGSTSSNNFPVTSGAFDETFNGNQDCFAVKLNPDASSIVYSTFIGGNDSETSYYYWTGQNIGLIEGDQLIVTGHTESTDFPVTEGAYNEEGGSLFISRINSTGSSLISSTYFGESTLSTSSSIVEVNIRNNKVYLCGHTNSYDFPLTEYCFDSQILNSEAFISVLNYDLTELEYSTYLGGSSPDFAFGMSVLDNDIAYICGRTDSRNFPVTENACYYENPEQNWTGFITKIELTPERFINTQELTSSIYCSGEVISINFDINTEFHQDNIFIAQLSGPDGSFDNALNLDSLCSISDNIPITVTVPDTLPYGDAYRFRVISTSPVANYTNNGEDITINPKPLADILFPEMSVCTGSSYIYTCLEEPNIEYSWSAPGANIYGPDNSPTFTVSWDSEGPAELQLTVTNSVTGCTADRLLDGIQVYQTPEPEILDIDNDTIYVEQGSHLEYSCGQEYGIDYQWYVSGGEILGPSNRYFIYVKWGAGGAGSLTVEQTRHGSNCSGTREYAAMIHSAPGQIAGSNYVCSNEESFYSIEKTPDTEYEWKADNGQLIDQTVDTCAIIQWQEPGPARVLLVRTFTKLGTSDTLLKDINIYELPNVKIYSTAVQVCESEISKFLTNQADTLTSIWKVAGGELLTNADIDSADVQWDEVPDGEEYLSAKVTLIRSHKQTGCVDSSIKIIKIYPIPDKPLISEQHDTLQSSPGDSYQWYFEGEKISGATGQKYYATEEGDYNVEITINGCSSMSEAYPFTPSAVDDYENAQMQLKASPNPMTGATEISYYLAGPGPVSLSIYDLTGSRVATLVSDEFRGMGRHSAKFEGRGLATGTYYCKLSYRGRVHSILLVVSR